LSIKKISTSIEDSKNLTKIHYSSTKHNSATIILLKNHKAAHMNLLDICLTTYWDQPLQLHNMNIWLLIVYLDCKTVWYLLPKSIAHNVVLLRGKIDNRFMRSMNHILYTYLQVFGFITKHVQYTLTTKILKYHVMCTYSFTGTRSTQTFQYLLLLDAYKTRASVENNK
jgi:hypothetical protein